jgi:hypothetical protein
VVSGKSRSERFVGGLRKKRKKGSPPKYTVRISLDLLDQRLPVVGFEPLYSSTFDGTASDEVKDTRSIDAGVTRHR